MYWTERLARKPRVAARGLWLLVVAVVSLTLLAACGGGADEDGSAPAPPPPAQSEDGGSDRVFFVSNLGSDGNDGLSPDTPWATLARALEEGLRPGDHLKLERGSVFRERLEIRASGTADQPIFYEAYGTGAAPVVSGADVVGAWSPDGSGNYVAMLATAPARAWVDDHELAYSPEVGDLSEGQFAFEDGRLHIRLAPGATPDAHEVEAAQRQVAISDEEGHSYITIRDIVGERTNGTAKTDAVFNARSTSDHWTIEGCTARDGSANGFFGEQSSRSGIGSHLRVIDSEAANNSRRGAVAAGPESRDQVFSGLRSHDNGMDGILINSRSGRLVGSRLSHNGRDDSVPQHGFYIYPWRGGGSDWQILDNELLGNETSGGRVAGVGVHVAGNIVAGSPYGFFVVDNDGPNSAHVVEDNLIMGTDPAAYAVELEGATGVVVRDNVLIESAGIGVVQGARRGNADLVVSGNRFGPDAAGAFVYVGPAQAAGLSVFANCFDPDLTLDGAKAMQDDHRALGHSADTRDQVDPQGGDAVVTYFPACS